MGGRIWPVGSSLLNPSIYDWWIWRDKLGMPNPIVPLPFLWGMSCSEEMLDLRGFAPVGRRGERCEPGSAGNLFNSGVQAQMPSGGSHALEPSLYQIYQSAILASVS